MAKKNIWFIEKELKKMLRVSEEEQRKKDEKCLGKVLGKCLGKVKYLICRDGEAQRGKRRKYNKLMEEKKKTKGNGGKHLDKENILSL